MIESASGTHNDELLAFFKLLSDVDRLKVAGLLATGPRSIDKIAGALSLPATDVLHHLALLTEAGVAADLGEGVYEFRPKAMEDLARRVLAGRASAPKVVDESGDDYERKVLADFTGADGRLKRLPAQQQKCEIILRYVNHVFEPGERYSEKQVNQMLLRFHDDTAALRRALIDYHFVTRQAGIYWRIDESNK